MYFIGIDLGGTSIKAGLIDENGIIVSKGRISTHRERTYQEIIKDMAKLALKLIESKGLDLSEIKYIGIGTPGTSDNEKGILGYANNFNFVNVPIREEMQKHINLPVYLENDANCAALAENAVGAARGTKNSISITLGTGIGSGIIIDGKIFSGFNDAAPEMGHMSIDINGLKCTCGRKGCWEMYASATALKEQTREAARKHPESLINELIGGDINKVGGKTAFIAARRDDKPALAVVENYLKYLADGIVNAINCFQPEVLTIGGGISNEGEYILKPVLELVEEQVYSRGDIAQTQIRISELGNDAGVIGAAMIGLKK